MVEEAEFQGRMADKGVCLEDLENSREACEGSRESKKLTIW